MQRPLIIVPTSCLVCEGKVCWVTWAPVTPVRAMVRGVIQCRSAQASAAFCKSAPTLKLLWGIKRGGTSRKLQGLYLDHKSCFVAPVTLKVDTSDQSSFL